MRHRIDALLPQGEVVVRTIHHLLGNLSPRKKVMAFVVAGVAGLALLLLLEISVRRELAAEARHVAIDTVSASSASAQEIQFEDRFAIQPAASTLLQPVDPLDALGTIPSSEYSQTFGQPIREPVPVPRRRKARWEIGAPHCRKAGADTWVRAGTHVELRSFQRTYVGTMRL